MPPVQRILLLGSDERGESSGGVWLTDAIMVVTLDSENMRIGMLGIPRDLWVSPPTLWEMRINQVDYLGDQHGYPGGGTALLADTLKETLGLEIDHYLRIRQEGFVQAIDAIGGVTIELDCPLQEFAPADQGSDQPYKELYLDAGPQQLDGQTALKFVTYRYRFGDWGRAKRQQALLLALREQALRLNIVPQIPRLWQIAKESIDSDLTLVDWLRLARFALQIDPEAIHGRVIDETMTDDLVTEKSGTALAGEMDEIMDAIETLFDVPPAEQYYDDSRRCPAIWPSPTPTAANQ
jgi:LCP family protein required for cell wall assembly